MVLMIRTIPVYNMGIVENAALFDGWWLAFDGCCSVPMGISPRKFYNRHKR